jgi:hypothetical protein
VIARFSSQNVTRRNFFGPLWASSTRAAARRHTGTNNVGVVTSLSCPVPVLDNAEGITNRSRSCQGTNGLSSVRRKETHTGSAGQLDFEVAA